MTRSRFFIQEFGFFVAFLAILWQIMNGFLLDFRHDIILELHYVSMENIMKTIIDHEYDENHGKS